MSFMNRMSGARGVEVGDRGMRPGGDVVTGPDDSW